MSYSLFVILTLSLNSNNLDRLSSFFIVTICAILALFILCFQINTKVGSNFLVIILTGFIIKLFLGYLFWEFYIFPDYFSNPFSVFKFDHMEYLYTESLMRDFAQQRIENGFFYFSPQMALYKHFEIHYFMSNLYISGSFNPFDLAVQNALFSIYTSFIVFGIANMLCANSTQLQFALILAVFQPFSMISSTIWRDVVGQFFVSLGGYVLFIAMSKRTIEAFVLIVIATISMYIQRFNYVFFPFIIYGTFLITKANKKVFFTLPVMLGLLIYFDNYFGIISGLLNDYGGNLASISLWLLLPLNVVRIFIGAFPWVNWFNFDDNSIFLIAGYFESVFLITMMFILFHHLRKKYNKNQPLSFIETLLMLLFGLFIFSAFGTVEIHQGYMSIGAIFIIPVISKLSGIKNFIIYSIFIFLVFICANVLYIILGLRGLGIGTSIR